MLTPGRKFFSLKNFFFQTQRIAGKELAPEAKIFEKIPCKNEWKIEKNLEITVLSVKPRISTIYLKIYGNNIPQTPKTIIRFWLCRKIVFWKIFFYERIAMDFRRWKNMMIHLPTDQPWLWHDCSILEYGKKNDGNEIWSAVYY